ncbi:MAG: nucleoside triphosphate pyrophosphohydrolase [Bdellovibrionales bacterium]|nr:nucleoside triphosphate pyrophosphohydrolase [Bdellovibrionales bacterium]
MKNPPKEYRSFTSLQKIIADLQDPDGGCPWDLEQTHRTLCKFAIEETYELVDAIEANDIKSMKEELGDVLLQVMLHAEIAKKASHFSIEDVIESIGTKMVRRHPHVFSDTNVAGPEEVLKNWEKIKQKEKTTDTKWFNFPNHLPALSISDKIGSKSQKYDFDWKTKEQVYGKVTEELQEVTEALETNDLDKIEDEIGDLLFVVAQLARHYSLDPEQALRRSNQKFMTRFTKMMDLAKSKGLSFNDLSLDEKENLWQEVKVLLKNDR